MAERSSGGSASFESSHGRDTAAAEPDSAEPQIRQVIVQPTSGCNLNCTYCYVPNRRDYTRMDDATMEAVISRVLNSNLVRDEIEFVWHAGEPLTVGLPFYRRAMDLIDRHNVRSLSIKNCIQTNGVLLDDHWCRFFADNRFIVGLSLDGPAFLHDRRRVHWSGRGSHSAAMRGYEALRRHNLSPGIICVLSRESLRHPAEIISFFLDNAVEYLCFNLEEIENANRSSSFVPSEMTMAAPAEDLVEEYRNFMSSFYDLWRPFASQMIVREFRDLSATFQRILSNSSFYSRPLETVDLGIVTIQKNGNISTYSPELAGALSPDFDDFIFGNILHDSLESVLLNDAYSKLRQKVSDSIAKCRRSCGYFGVCGGGFISNKFFENGDVDSTQTMTCLLHRQSLASVLIDKLSPRLQ